MPMKTAIDWLQFSIPEGNPIGETMDELNYHLPTKFDNVEHGMLGYEHQMLGVGGCRVLSTARRPEHHVILPGKWCEAVDPVVTTCLIDWIHRHQGNITRLDLAGDDSDKRVRPRDLKAFCEADQLVTKFRTVLMHDNIMGGKGSTIYFGSAASARRLRVYDKDIESGGENDSVRWELQLRDEMAQKCSEMILNQGISKTFFESLVGMVDFRDRDNRNVSRTYRTEWYQAIVNDAQKADYSQPRPVQTIERIDKWIRKQVSPSLATMVTALGGDTDYLNEIAVSGQNRLSDSQLLAIGAYHVKTSIA